MAMPEQYAPPPEQNAGLVPFVEPQTPWRRMINNPRKTRKRRLLVTDALETERRHRRETQTFLAQQDKRFSFDSAGTEQQSLPPAEMSEHAFRNAARIAIRKISERKRKQREVEADPSSPNGLNILVINFGEPTHDFDLPLELAKDNPDVKRIDFLSHNSETDDGALYKEIIRNNFGRFLDNRCNFSVASLYELMRLPKINPERLYDAVIIFNDDINRNVNSKFPPLTPNAEEFAKFIISILGQEGSIILSRDRSLSILRNELLKITEAQDNFTSIPDPNTVIIRVDTDQKGVDTETALVPANRRTDKGHIVWTLSRDEEGIEDIEDTVTPIMTARKRHFVPRTGKGRRIAAAAAASITVPAAVFGTLRIPSSESACPDRTMEIAPIDISSVTGDIFPIPNEPNITILIKGGTQTVSAPGYKPITSSVKQEILAFPTTPSFTIIPGDNRQVTVCEGETFPIRIQT